MGQGSGNRGLLPNIFMNR